MTKMTMARIARTRMTTSAHAAAGRSPTIISRKAALSSSVVFSATIGLLLSLLLFQSSFTSHNVTAYLFCRAHSPIVSPKSHWVKRGGVVGGEFGRGVDGRQGSHTLKPLGFAQFAQFASSHRHRTLSLLSSTHSSNPKQRRGIFLNSMTAPSSANSLKISSTISSSISTAIATDSTTDGSNVVSSNEKYFAPGKLTTLNKSTISNNTISLISPTTTTASSTTINRSNKPITNNSTAIILNMNARSVTPELISIATAVVGKEHVYVTNTLEDAKRAARMVVLGSSKVGSEDVDGNNDGITNDKYSLVVPVGGDGTLSGWINSMVDEILIMNEEQQQQQQQKVPSSAIVENAVRQLPLVGYIPMGTGNGMGYVIGCRTTAGSISTTTATAPDDEEKDSNSSKTVKREGRIKSVLSKIGWLTRRKQHRLEHTHQVMVRLKEVGDILKKMEQQQNEERYDDDEATPNTKEKDNTDVEKVAVQLEDALSEKCSIVEMPMMEVTHHSKDAIENNPSSFSIVNNGNVKQQEQHNMTTPSTTNHHKGDLCFFAGAGFDSLMLHDFQQLKAWSSSPSNSSATSRSSRLALRLLPPFVKDALSSVTGYCVALVTKTLPQTLRYGTHKIHVVVTTPDKGTLWVDHRRGDFSELAVKKTSLSTPPFVKPYALSNSTHAQPDDQHDRHQQKQQQHLLYSGTTGILAASTTPYYGGGMRLFPYARLIPNKLQLRLGRISPLTGFLNIPKIFEGSYREKSERQFGCLDFIGEDFEVEVTSGQYEEYLKRKEDKKKAKVGGSRRWWRMGKKENQHQSRDDDIEANNGETITERRAGFPFQHSGESMGCKERFRLRVVKESVKFVSFLEPRVVVDD